MLIGFNLVHRATFRYSNERNTGTLLLGIAILSLGISTSGMIAMLCTPHYVLLVLLYSVVGGFGYQLVFSRMWKVLAKIFNARKEMFVVKFLHSCGQATSLLVLLVCFQVPWEGYIYGVLLVLLTGVVLHLVPLTILIAGEKGRLRSDLDALVQLTEKGNESYYAHVATRAVPEVKSESSINPPETPPTSTVPLTWKNPANFSASHDDDVFDQEMSRGMNSHVSPLDDYTYREYEESLLNRQEGKCYNQDGVEILEMILEEDEPTEEDALDHTEAPRTMDDSGTESDTRSDATRTVT
uniref:Uncharacterized protein n=1 Tax=Anopheles maculatus TaxID=74869 RepID=A0A182SQE8_9DIPT